METKTTHKMPPKNTRNLNASKKTNIYVRKGEREKVFNWKIMLELSLNKNLNCRQCKLKKTRCKLDAHKVQVDRILGQQKMRNVTNISSFLSFCLVPVCFIEFRDENDNLRNHDKSVAHTRTNKTYVAKRGVGECGTLQCWVFRVAGHSTGATRVSSLLLGTFPLAFLALN